MRRVVAVAMTVVLLWGVFPARASTVGISSLSAVVYQPDSGLVLYEKDADTPRPMASTTKLMTALLAAENLAPDRGVTVPSAALPVEGSQLGLRVGDTLTVRDLLTGLLLSSGNDTANVLALTMADSLSAFAERMNKRAAALGMIHSFFVTPSGLDGEGHAASARDMALLGAAVLKQPLLAELCASKTAPVTVNGNAFTVKNHNRLLSLYTDCIGMKTGFTKKSGRCLVSAARRNGVTLIVVTLNGGDYWNDHIALYEYAFPLVERRQLPVVADVTCPVIGGTEKVTALSATAPPTCVMRAGETITYRIEKPLFLWAPVKQGAEVGRVVYTVGDRRVATVPLTASAVSARPVPSAWALWWRRVGQLTETLIA